MAEREEEVELLRREAASAYQDVERARRAATQRQREVDQLLSAAAVGVRSVRTDLERIRASRAWRLGHGVARAGNRARLRRNTTDGAVSAALARLDVVLDRLQPRRTQTGRTVAPSAPGVPHIDPAAQRRLAARLRQRLGAAPSRERWPGVSILVVSQNGARLLERLLDGLAMTDYPDHQLELIVVDNASADDSVAVLEGTRPPFEVRIERSAANTSYAEANNRAASLATHPLLLLLNNDVEPFEAGWLKELVDGLLGSGAGAMGATLLHATLAPETTALSGFAVQHRGIAIERHGGLARLHNRDDGGDLFDPGFGVERQSAAASAACLLLERETFESAGGLDSGYRYGLEDVELAFMLHGQQRRVACSGRAVLLHDESSTRRSQDREVRRLDRLVNHRRLAERWGPALRRELRLALARRDEIWVSGAALHATIVRTSNDPAEGWGDYYTAAELGEALAALGWRVDFAAHGRGDNVELRGDVDVAIALTDRLDVRRLPAHVTAIAWIRNWTERWLERPWLDRYDLLLASSRRSVELVHQATGRQATLFPLATNPRRFSPRRSTPELASDYVITANRWGKPRAVESALRPTSGERPAIYGLGWEHVRNNRKHARGNVPYERLPDVYASSLVVVDDTADPALAYDAVNARVFDTLATGTPVITNCARGAAELFDVDFPTWSNTDDLRSGLDELLRSPMRRQELGRRYRARVLAEHTYERRARQLQQLVVESDQRWSFCLKVGAPNWELAERWGDLHLARDLSRALKRKGHRCLIQVLSEWDDEDGLAYDVAVHLKGRSTYQPKPGQLNVLWLISHPTELAEGECDAYDLVCVASSPFADSLKRRTTTPVAVLEQGTDPWRFRSEPVPELAHDLLFVANTRGVRRRILADLLPTRHDLAVWGSGWDGLLPAGALRGEWMANDTLRQAYSSAKIVLCDHWDDMRDHGFASNRLYDAVACGAVVVSDDVAMLDDRFGEAVVTYRTADDLRETIERLLASPQERARRAAGARERLLAAHTLDHRAAELLRLARARAAQVGHTERILAPR